MVFKNKFNRYSNIFTYCNILENEKFEASISACLVCLLQKPNLKNIILYQWDNFSYLHGFFHHNLGFNLTNKNIMLKLLYTQ